MEYDDMRAVLRDYNWDDGFAFLSDSEGKSGPKEWRDFKTAKGIQIARILSRFTVLQMRWPLFFSREKKKKAGLCAPQIGLNFSFEHAQNNREEST